MKESNLTIMAKIKMMVLNAKNISKTLGGED